MRTIPRFWKFTPGAVAFLVLWVAFLAAGRTGFFRDPGTFWHTVVGDRILQGGFFATDPFTFTFAGATWIPHQWLGEVLMALAHRVAGLDTLLLGAATLLAFTFALPAGRLLRTGLHPVAAGLIVLAAVAAAASHFHVRPHLATIAGMMLTALLLTDVDSGRRRLLHLAWLVPLFLVWSNCHGGMLGGLVLLALAAAGWTLTAMIGWPSPVRNGRQVAWLAVVGLGCGLTALVNPYGVELPRTWLTIMDSPALPRIIQEHAPLDVTEPKAWPVVAFTLLYLFVLAGTFPRGPRVAWLLPLFWMVQAYGRVRHAPLFAVTGLVAIAAMWPHTRWAAWLARTRPDFQKPLTDAEQPQPFAGIAWPLLAVALALGIQLTGVRLPLVGVGWVHLDEQLWPVDLTETLRAYEPAPGQGNRLFNEYIDGGFVIYHAPGYRVFVDDRCELFGDQWLLDFVHADGHDTAAAINGWEERYGDFDFALTRTDSGFDRYFASAPHWHAVKRTPHAAFYERR